MKYALVLLCTFAQWCMAVEMENAEAKAKLTKYGYMGSSSMLLSTLTDENAFPQALMEYQWNMGLATTGQLDEDTKKMLRTTRCGNKDISHMSDIAKKRRRKRYALSGGKWSTTPISYRESSYTSDLPQSTVRRVFREALQVWSDVANIDFQRRASGNVDLDLKFATRDHGDGNAFDGRSGTLAHAYFPRNGAAIEGDAHFDDDETWTDKTFQGTNLFQVAVHEFGHSLGISHSRDRSSIMYPSYLGYQQNFRLGTDDISAIQAIYGRRIGATMPPTQPTTTTTRRTTPFRTTRRTTTTTTTVRPGNPDRELFCSFNSFDAIEMINDMTYAFKNDLYVKLDESGIAPGYPRRITVDFQGAPNDVDAVLNWEDGKTFIFKGSQYWRYSYSGSRFTLNSGYPRYIRDGFEGIPDDIDFAMVWGANGKTYFFKGDKYYRYERSRGVPSYYPRPAALWDGLPFSGQGVSAAFKWRNRRTYFFSGGSYYRFDDWNFEVDKNANPSYPRPLASWWLNCPGTVHSNMEMDDKDTGMNEVTGTGDLVTGGLDGAISAAVIPRANPVALTFVCVFLFWTISACLGTGTPRGIRV